STRCSPRTWGWSGLGRLRSRLLLVLPTHVGMVRPPPEAPWRPPRAPHARGDGPTGEVEMGPVAPCSPRTWGWSAGGCAAVRAGPVLPTHVGMVRPPTPSVWAQPCAPHARGDGPHAERGLDDSAPCSPRTWGWSDRYGLPNGLFRVLPTHVGMVRTPRETRGPRICAPHARGDGPPSAAPPDGGVACSPRTWGWSTSGCSPFG